jgi:hypothetical protein
MHMEGMMEGKMEGKMGMMCKCPHHKVVPGLTVLFGLLFLAGYMGWVSMNTVQLGWPILVILAGIMKMSRGMCKCCGNHTCGMC